jgi:amino-acid N-acetyltransferase
MKAVRAINGAHRSDLAGIRWLLDLESLPSADITEEMLDHFLVYRDAIGVAGVVGLECYGDAALLRSLVIADGYARYGLGKRLVVAAEKLATELNIFAIYLATPPQMYFESMGYRYILQENVPSVIQQSAHFKSLCLSTAVLLMSHEFPHL